jgi:hypothetical protein
MVQGQAGQDRWEDHPPPHENWRMKPLTIELKNCAPSQFQSIAWKTSRPDDYRREFYALDQTRKVVVVTLKPALPDFYDPNRQARAVCSRDPFPKAVCVEISPCRLLPPPCYQSREDFDGQLPCHPTFEPWKWIYWQTHRQVLIAEPSDDGPLQERLDKWLAVMRAAYEHERKTVRAEIERLTTKPLSELGFEKEEQRAKRTSDLQAYLVNFVESETPIDNAVCKCRLKLTLADVKLGHEGIRDAWMHEDWAAKNGQDLGVMLHERRVFRRWLETHTGTRANVFDMTTRERWREIAPPRFGERFESNPRFLEACAMVRYRARFADNANTIVYLADCELREEPTAQEFDEVAKLLGAPTKVRRQMTTKLDKPNPHARFERDFSIVVIPQPKGEPLSVAIEPELQSLLKRIIEAGGRIPRTALRKGKSDTFQPEKLLCSQAAKAIMKARLLGRTTKGRTTVFWAKVEAD